MDINSRNLGNLFNGFKTSFNDGFTGAASAYRDVAMVVPSTAESETYAWLGQIPKVREWLGDRVIKSLMLHGYTITNRLFEDTVSVGRTKVEDDSYGVFSPLFEELGKAAAETPDELVFNLLPQGFNTKCYDGQYFFDTDHPVGVNDSDEISVSNVIDGPGEPWYLLDCSRAIKPIVYQERIPFDKLVRKDNEQDDNVFFKDEYIYGVRGRGNAGFGLWQMALASKQPLTPENYEAARKQMQNLKGDEDRPLGIKPDTLVVSPNLEGEAMRLLNNGSRVVTMDNGAGTNVITSVNNEWKDTAKPIITPWALPA